MGKSHFLIIIAAVFQVTAQSNPTIAILEFENKAFLKNITMQRVSDRIINEFSKKGTYVVYDCGLIDTMMSSKGNKNLLKCRDESCLFAIGHLLNVDLVLNGSILKSNKRFLISIDLVDIKNNAAVGSQQIVVTNFYDSTLQKTIPGMVAKLIELKKAKEIKIATVSADQSGMEQRQKLENSGIGKTDSTNNGKNKKAGWLKRNFWYPVSAVVLGGAAAGVYYFKIKHRNTDGNTPPDDGISLNGAPIHRPEN